MSDVIHQYNQTYYKKNKDRILARQKLKYDMTMTFCGACGRSMYRSSFNMHIKSKVHINFEKEALFDIYDFPFRNDVYIPSNRKQNVQKLDKAF